MRKFAAATLVLLVGAWIVTARPSVTHEQPAEPTKAICVLSSMSGSKVTGTVTFTKNGDEIEITGQITGLTPGPHGFHVHEFGDITGADGMTTGGHFNPEGKKHGGPHAADRHVGDLGNVIADDKGVVTLNMKDKMIKLSGPNSIVGRGLIVHAKADDEKTQPTGDAGGRVGGGVIGVAAPPKK